MADITKINRPLTRDSVRKAHELIKPYIHQTPVLQCATISDLASTAQDTESALYRPPNTGNGPAHPRLNLFFKCENYQKIGAFKARGAFHALSRLTDGQLEHGVVTNSSGNHAQALALAAYTRGVPAYIVMPEISTPSKIASTKAIPGTNVIFSGSTQHEREEVMQKVRAETGAVYVPPYDHPDVILGQGTMALEFEGQVKELLAERVRSDREREGFGWRSRAKRREKARVERTGVGKFGHELHSEGLDAVIAPVGGGGMLSGIATALYGTGAAVFGAEPEFEGADDCKRGLAQNPPRRVEKVSTLTIADGLRTPVGEIPWTVISDPEKLRGVYSVTEEQIKSAMRLLFERAKIVVEPSGAVALAAVLFNEDLRRILERLAGEDGWNVGIILSGGNTTMEAIAELFAASS